MDNNLISTNLQISWVIWNMSIPIIQNSTDQTAAGYVNVWMTRSRKTEFWKWRENLSSAVQSPLYVRICVTHCHHSTHEWTSTCKKRIALSMKCLTKQQRPTGNVDGENRSFDNDTLPCSRNKKSHGFQEFRDGGKKASQQEFNLHFKLGPIHVTLD